MTEESESLVREVVIMMSESRAEHEEFCLKIGGPSSKAKYSLLTDSEPVP